MLKMLFCKSQTKQAILLSLIALLVLLSMNYEYLKQLKAHQYFIYEQDAYMHLFIAQDFLNHLNLYDHFNLRINAPWGADTHGWTNILTLILAAGACVLKCFMPSSDALYLWAFFLPVLTNALASGLMLWAIKPLKPSFSQKLFIILAFLINPFLQSYFVPLRVDYDFLLITISIIYWGFFLRLLKNESTNNALLAGLSACLGLWTSISFMLPLIFSLVFLFAQNLLNKIQTYTLKTLLLSLIFFLIPIIFLEQYPFFTVSHDTISLVHLVFFIGIFIAYSLYQLLSPSTTVKKIVLFLTLGLVLCFLMNYLFPGFYLGPYNQAAPFVLQHFFPSVSEFHSPFLISNPLALALFSYFFIGSAYCYFLFLTEGLSREISFLLFNTLLLALLTAYMYRWCIYFLPLTIFLISFCIQKLEQNPFIHRWSVFILLLALPQLILLMAKEYTNPEQHLCEEQLYAMLGDNFFKQAPFTQDKRLLTHSNYGPLILYNTEFSILATNDHHNPQGLEDNYYFFKGTEDQAKAIAIKRDFDLLLLCPKGYFLGFDPQYSTWLNQVVLPPKYSKWQLYRIKKGRADEQSE